MKKYLPFRLLVLTIFIGLIVPFSIQDGMFMDGLIYATVSHNLANGFGTFWFPTFSEHYMNDYSEQLPLFFGMQSIFFKLLGDSFYTERIFSLLMAIITAFNIQKIWQLVYRNEEGTKQLDWVPVLIWILIPIISWSYIHNVEEVLMGVFATASVFFILKGLITQKHIIGYLIVGGVFVFLTSFCKGPQGLFTVVTIAFYWLFYRNISFSKALGYSLLLISIPIAIYGMLLINDTSFASLENYYNNRIIRTFTKSYSATTTNHFSLIYRIFQEFIPAFIILAISIITVTVKQKAPQISLNWKHFGFFLAIGLSGSLPLMVTLEQRGFYLTTSFHFYAIAFAVIVAAYIQPLVSNINTNSKGYQNFKNAMIVALIGVIVFSGMQFGKTKRDKDELHDIYIIGENIPTQSSVSITKSLNSHYQIKAYFTRYFYIHIDGRKDMHHPYFLSSKDETNLVPEGYQLMPLDLITYDLYEQTTSNP